MYLVSDALFDGRRLRVFSRPDKLTDNAFVQSFDGRLRDACLNSTDSSVAGGGTDQDRGLAAGRWRKSSSHGA